jgi:hypothetical protein
MDWTASVDGYCERLMPGLWAEPWNLITNLAFIAVAVVMRQRCKGLTEGRVLAAVTFAIGIGSGLFHALAVGWAGLVDVLPIVVFILAYVFLAARDFLGLRPAWAGLAMLAVIPYAALTTPVFARIPQLGSSASYAPIPVLILLFVLLLAGRKPRVARGLAVGALLLVLSLAFRTLDLPLCEMWPTGLHFLWHLINALMLGWMIEVWRRHRLEGPAVGR